MADKNKDELSKKVDAKARAMELVRDVVFPYLNSYTKPLSELGIVTEVFNHGLEARMRVKEVGGFSMGPICSLGVEYTGMSGEGFDAYYWPPLDEKIRLSGIRFDQDDEGIKASIDKLIARVSEELFSQAKALERGE